MRTVGAVVRRDLADHRLIGLAFVLDLVFGVINLAAFLLLTRWLTDGPATAAHFQYVAVGVALLLALQSTVGLVLRRAAQEQRSGTLEFLTASGASPEAILGGTSVLPAAVGQLRMLLYLGLAALVLGLRLDRTDWVGVAVMVVLGAGLCLAVAAALAAVALAVRGGATAGRVLIALVGLVSGVFVPLDQLPPAMAAIGHLLPITAVLDGLRLAVAGGPWGPAALASVLWVAGSAVLALVACRVGLRVSRRRGALVPV